MSKRRILDYISKNDYQSLPQQYKDKRQQLTDLGRTIDKLNRRKDKINKELQTIYTSSKSLNKQYTQLFKELQFFNKQYIPKCYVVIDKRYEDDYLNLVIKHTKTTSIYLGRTDKIIEQLKPFIPNLNNKNYKIKLNDFLSQQIRKLIDYDNPNFILENTIKFKDILKMLNDNDKPKSFFNYFD